VLTVTVLVAELKQKDKSLTQMPLAVLFIPAGVVVGWAVAQAAAC
jgi:L-amino acid N-acyltransferase YncA